MAFDLNFDLDLEEEFEVLEDVSTEDFMNDINPPKKRRFDEVTTDDVEHLLHESENKNTKRKTDHDLRLIQQFISECFPQLSNTDLAEIADDVELMTDKKMRRKRV
eukprot:TRINITY_DN6912_c0_g1_i5.p1 TRINITY_DN6912_c0_g1~~TRINITY_DN6912_c0_g1_i5.p1  ORF type:complete len:106 (-),score=18.09 TRINITY_DN6912_c0_g1_i5:253-570(-)